MGGVVVFLVTQESDMGKEKVVGSDKIQKGLAMGGHLENELLNLKEGPLGGKKKVFGGGKRQDRSLRSIGIVRVTFK